MSIESNMQETLSNLMRSLTLAVKRSIQEHELPVSITHLRVMHLIRTIEGCTANTIANKMMSDKGQVTRLVKELMAKELVEKQPNPEDRRSQFLILTPPGEAVMQVAKEAELRLWQQMQQGLSDEEIKTFQRIAGILIKNLD